MTFTATTFNITATTVEGFLARQEVAPASDWTNSVDLVWRGRHTAKAMTPDAEGCLRTWLMDIEPGSVAAAAARAAGVPMTTVEVRA